MKKGKGKKRLGRPPKKKLGRPVGSKNKKVIKAGKKAKTKDNKHKIKKSMKKLMKKLMKKPGAIKGRKRLGRPPGSKNKKAKIKKIVKKIEEVVVVKRHRRKKGSTFIGYCPECETMLMERDLESKMIFICPSCNKRARTKLLVNAPKRLDNNDKPTSKQAYIKDTINANYHDMPSFHSGEDIKNVVVDK